MRAHLQLTESNRRGNQMLALTGRHDLSNAACQNTASLVLCVVRRVKDHHSLLHYSLRLKKTVLKKTLVRQVVLNKWFPLF